MVKVGESFAGMVGAVRGKGDEAERMWIERSAVVARMKGRGVVAGGNSLIEGLVRWVRVVWRMFDAMGRVWTMLGDEGAFGC